MAEEHARLAALHRHLHGLAFAVERVVVERGVVLQRHEHHDVAVAPREVLLRVRVARVGVRRLRRRRRVVALVVDAREERVRVARRAVAPGRRRQPPQRAERLGEGLHPRRRLLLVSDGGAPVVSTALAGLQLPLLAAVVEDALEARLRVDVGGRRQVVQHQLGGPVRVQLPPLVGLCAPLGVLFVQRLQHFTPRSSLLVQRTAHRLLCLERLVERALLRLEHLLVRALRELTLGLLLPESVELLRRVVDHTRRHLLIVRRLLHRGSSLLVRFDRASEDRVVRRVVRLRHHRPRGLARGLAHRHVTSLCWRSACQRRVARHLDGAEAAGVVPARQIAQLQREEARAVGELVRVFAPQFETRGKFAVIVGDVVHLAVHDRVLVADALEQYVARVPRWQHPLKLAPQLADQPLGEWHLAVGERQPTARLVNREEVEVADRRAAPL
mmetsp:Transcript_69316/g.208018  ORF Transcript_69316/g.208018 Transcript_69316/m.208018 type:complete len:443 (+) Transcript_69316:519-1847(+)